MLRSFFQKYRNVSLLYIILFFSVILLLLVALLVNQKFRSTAYNFAKVHEGHELLNELNDVQSTITKTSTEVRTFTITGAPHPDLVLYKVQMERRMQRIAELTRDPHQMRVLDTLRMNISTRFDMWEHMISISNDSLKRINDQLFIETSVLTNNILGEIMQLRKYASSVVYDHLDDTETNIRLTGFMALLVTLFCISVIIFAIVRLHREVNYGILVQAELSKKVKELDRTNDDLERFAYVASHDLHEPLRKLYAFSEILIEREKNLSTEGLEIIRRMHSFVTRMQQLIDDMLQFSLNLNKVEKKVLDLNIVVKNVINNLAVKMNETNASVEVGMLPAQVEGYESQISQLFQNIISNSIKYSRPDVPPHIRITATEVSGSDIGSVRPIDEKKKFHKITLSDNGIGFDDKYREKIFIIFQRLHGKSEYSGSGIGLATAKRVVDNHNGYITAHGEENKGADFNIYLPKE
ncbi:MAG: hypothetical protein JST90_19320 [Bacteroidetes bacterium]|nr:hypothetical protein [Bacteroidota bacterium]